MANKRVIEVSDYAARDVFFIARHPDVLGKVLVALRDAPLLDAFQDIFEWVSDKTGLADQEVTPVIRSLMNFHHIATSMKVGPTSFFDLVTEAIDRKNLEEWRTECREKWLAAKPAVSAAIEELTLDHPLTLLNKVSELTYAHQRVLNSSRIITDVRPVFRTDATSVVKSIVIHKLLIDHSSGGSKSRTEYALDAADVAELKRQCIRAEEKAAAIKALLAKADMNPVVPQEDTNE
ncbi:MAG: hypothetical protein DCC68_06010 [Planctomycetota bacterium]|nr:MAG: hypothetical protein DCC68_06010 [Planctomycetota bacterium]